MSGGLNDEDVLLKINLIFRTGFLARMRAAGRTCAPSKADIQGSKRYALAGSNDCNHHVTSESLLKVTVSTYSVSCLAVTYDLRLLFVFYSSHFVFISLRRKICVFLVFE